MKIERLGSIAGVAAMVYSISFLLTAVLDGLFGFLPDHPFLDDGWVWFLKPAFWTFLLMWVYGHAHEKGKLDAFLGLHQTTIETQSDR
jgi:hypothetical protein